MQNDLNIRDLAIRIFVIAIFSIVLIFVTRDDNFDLHFKLRKVQESSKEVLLIEVSDDESFEKVIDYLIAEGAETIFVNQFNFDQKKNKVLPYSVDDRQAGFLNLELLPDRDGLVRRVRILDDRDRTRPPDPPLILNFRGPGNSFPTLHFLDLSNSDLKLEGMKIILAPSTSLAFYTTPLGIMAEVELVANFVDNMIEHRFIPKKNFSVAFVILVVLLTLTTFFLIYLPSTLALISSIAIIVTYISVSLWVFDVFNIWTPILTPAAQMLLTFLLISNYKFILNEKTRWSLEKESMYFEKVEEMKTNFLSLFSQDLKTPLAKILGISDTLRSKITDPEIVNELEKIHQASRDLEKYIKRILKMSQVQSKNISLNRAPEDINTLIEKSIEQNRLNASEKSITIEKKLPPMFMVDMDGALIQEVIINFLENAITYSPENSKIVVSSTEMNDYIKVSVKDQGKGIPKKAQENIWEKYYRFDSTEAGYGLGLFLSRYVISLHGGHVFLNSKVGEGSEFGFVIPIDGGQVG